MRILKFNYWKLITFILFIILIFIIYKVFQEYKRNLPYKNDVKNFQNLLNLNKNLNNQIKRQLIFNRDPLNLEKERKDKFGEALEGEKVIFIDENLLKSVYIPFLQD